MLQLFVTEKDRTVTFAIDGFIDAAAEKNLSACVTEILVKHPLAVTLHFCNLNVPKEDGFRVIEFLGNSLAQDGAKVFLSGFNEEVRGELIRRGQIKENQIFDTIQDSRDAATADREGR